MSHGPGNFLPSSSEVQGSCRLHALAETVILAPMAVHLQIRDLPAEIHRTLRQRAVARGLSLRQYALEVLQEHCRQPTLDEWLDGLSQLTPVSLSTPAAEAVRQARETDDDALIDAPGRP
jgi:antitoxin FitA